MANDTDIAWAIYTGDQAPFRSTNTIWCAWHSGHALFVTDVGDNQFLAVCGNVQLGGSSLEEAKTNAWKYAENHLGGTVAKRAHIMNFRKV